MNYIKTHGQELETAYPYTAVTGTCKYSAASGKVNVNTIANVTPSSVAQLKAAIAQGPTSVTVEAGLRRPTQLCSNNTLEVSSTQRLAEPTLTTPSPLSDMELTQLPETTTSSETHGVHLGELKVTLTLLLLTESASVVFNRSQFGQPQTELCSNLFPIK